MTRQLEGRELLFASSSRAAYTICDAFHILVDACGQEALQRYGRAAMIAVAAKHPLLRTYATYSDRAPPSFVTVGKIPEEASAAMFSVVPAVDSREWERLVHRSLNSPADRSHLPIWKVVLVLPSAEEASAAEPSGEVRAHLIVTTDHCVADGFSCSRVAHDFLTAVSMLAQRAASDTTVATASTSGPLFEPLPLPPTARHICHGGEPGRLFRWTAGPFIDMMGSAALRALRKTPPVLPLHPAVAACPLVVPYRPTPTPGWALFASGRRESLTASLSRCKAERVTLHGAVLAALLAAHSRVALRAGRPTSPPEEQLVAMNMDVDFNLRKRAKPSLGDEHVGLLISWGTLVSFAPSGRGVRMSERFWDVARRGKADTEAMIGASDTWLSHFFFDRAFASELAAASRLASSCPAGVIGDINVSNLGVYPFPARHEIAMATAAAGTATVAGEGAASASAAVAVSAETAGAGVGGGASGSADSPARRGSITITSHHLVNSASPVSSCGIWFLTTVAGAPAYSLMYKSEHEPTGRVFADAVAAFEGIGTIGPEETMASVAARLCTWGAPAAVVSAGSTGAAAADAAAGGAGAGAVAASVPSAAPPYAPITTETI